MKRASSYQEWQAAAEAYDRYRGLDRWRRTDETSQYDHASLRIRLDTLRGLAAQGDIPGLLYNLNEGIHGNAGGMGKAGLYGHAAAGTKHLIADYIEAVVHALELIDSDDSGEVSFGDKLNFFRRASHSFGRTALMLSASGSLYFFHFGVARALIKAGLLPSVISGSSGGSLAGGMICTHSDEKLLELLRPEYFLEQASELENTRGSGDRGSLLQEGLRRTVPDLTFKQALDTTGRAINISIAPSRRHQTSRLLNAVTSPDVLIHSAIRASCAVPGFFPPVVLEALDNSGQRKTYLPHRSWVDGAVSDDLPAKRLARLYGVNHTVVSQTNPNVVPFVRDTQQRETTLSILRQGAGRSAREWFNTWAAVAERARTSSSTMKRVNSAVRSLINQEYVGDINIVADHRFLNPFTLLDAPDEKQMRRLFDSGERSTWPKLEMIRLQSRISRKLDALVADYESDDSQRSPG